MRVVIPDHFTVIRRSHGFNGLPDSADFLTWLRHGIYKIYLLKFDLPVIVKKKEAQPVLINYGLC